MSWRTTSTMPPQPPRPPARGGGRRRATAGVLLGLSFALVFGGAAIWSFLLLREVPATAEHADAAPAAPLPRPTPPRFSSPPVDGTAEPPALATRRSDPGPGRAFMQRYRGRSGRLHEGVEPAERYAASPVTSRRGAPMVVTTGGRHVDLDATLMLRALFPDASVVATGAEWQWRPAGRAASPWRPMRLRGPQELTAEVAATRSDFALGAEAVPAPFLADIAVRARGTWRGEPFTQELITMVFVQKSGARILAGTARVAPRGGDLTFSIEVAIDRPGSYFAYAELWSLDGERRPIAFARQRLDPLGAGRQRIELFFGGAIIRESGIPGPYTIRNLELGTADTVPPHRAPPLAEVAETPAWDATMFE